MKMKNMGNSHSMPSKSWRKTQRDRDRKLVFESSRGVKSVALGMEGRFHGQASAPFFPQFESYSLFWGWLEVFDELLIREKGSSKLWKQCVLLIFSVQKHSPVSKLIFLLFIFLICLKSTTVSLVRSDNWRYDCSVCFDFLTRVRKAALGWGQAFGCPPVGT